MYSETEVVGTEIQAPVETTEFTETSLLTADDIFPTTHLAVTGLLLVIGGFMNFTFTLALHAAAANVRRN